MIDLVDRILKKILILSSVYPKANLVDADPPIALNNAASLKPSFISECGSVIAATPLSIRL